MTLRLALAVLMVLGAFLTACRTTAVPANEGVTPVLKGTPFYGDRPGTEQAWWGTIGPGLGSEARYELGVYDFPRNLPMDEGGNVDLEGGERNAELEPFAQVYASVIIYGKAALTTPDIPGGSYGTLYVGEIGGIEGGRIGCDPRRIPEAERAGTVVVGGDCNHYLEVPEPEETYRGVLRVGERGPPPPPDRRHYPYFLDTEGGRLFVAVEVMPELERLVGREVMVDGKLVDVGDGRGPHQVLRVGVVRAE